MASLPQSSIWKVFSRLYLARAQSARGDFDAAMWNDQPASIHTGRQYLGFNEAQVHATVKIGTSRPWGRMMGVGAFRDGPAVTTDGTQTFGRTVLDHTNPFVEPSIHHVVTTLGRGAMDISLDGVQRTVTPALQSTCAICDFCADLPPEPPEQHPDFPVWIANSIMCQMFASASGGNGAANGAATPLC